MSQTKAQLISGTATQDLTVENITSTKINDAPIRNPNLVINGAMLVAQRGTSSTSSGIHTVDRFFCNHTGTNEAPTQAQVDVASGTTPYTSGFRKAFKITNGNQTSGAGAGDFIFIQTKLEAQDVANSGWDYLSTTNYVTLSFWVKSSVAQDFKGYLRSRDGTERVYPFATGSLTADTWTKVTKTIPGNSGLQFDNDNGEGLQIVIGGFFGTDYTDNSATEDAWATWGSGATRVKDNTSTWYTTNDATLEVTGVKLELGSVATGYFHLTNAEELIQCQRYFQKVRGGIGTSASSTQVNGVLITRVIQRSDATLSKGTGNTYNYGNMINTGYTSTGTPTFFRNDGPLGHYCYSLAGFSGLPTGDEQRDEGDGGSATFDLDAEL